MKTENKALTLQKSGFTLIESVIGVLILSVATLGISAIEAELLKSQLSAEQYFEASTLAQQKMEELRNFSTLTIYQNITSGSDTLVKRNATYTRNWTVVTTTSPAYKTVTITINWISSKGVSESLSFSSNIGAADPYLGGRIISIYNPASI